MEMDDEGANSRASLNQDILERIGCELSLREVLCARLVCRQWRQHVATAVRYVPNERQREQRQLVELDAQPDAQPGGAWWRCLTDVAVCLPQLSEIMVYVSSRVSEEQLGVQLRCLPAALPGLTKLELRYIVPSSAPCLGTSLQQLQPSLAALTALETLYLIMGASPEPEAVSSVLPALPALRDLKLLSGLPQYGFTNAKLEALGCATQLQRLHVEVSGVGQVDAGLAALSRMSGLRQLWLDGMVTLGPAVVCAMQQLPVLQELRLELDSPQHILDLFALPSLQRLSLTYHGDELEEAEDAPPPLPPLNRAAAAGAGAGSGSDWDALGRIVRGHTERPVLRELGLVCCSFPADPLPRLALLTSLTSLTFYDCRWKAAAPQRAVIAGTPCLARSVPESAAAAAACGAAAAIVPAAPALPAASWSALTSLGGLQGFGMSQCVVPPISEFDMTCLAAAWSGITSLQLQSPDYRVSQLPQRSPPARFGAVLAHWRRLEALSLSGSWCNDPRVALDVSLLPPSLTSLVVSSVTLVNSAAIKAAVLDGLCGDVTVVSLASPATADKWCGRADVFVERTGGAASLGTDEEEFLGQRTSAASAGPGGGNVLPPDAWPTSVDEASSATARNSSSHADARTYGTVPRTNCRGTAAEQAFNTKGGNGINDNRHRHSGSSDSSNSDDGRGSRSCQIVSHAPSATAATAAEIAAAAAPLPPDLPGLEHLVLGEVRLGAGVSLEQLARWAPNLRSLEINNLLPNLTDEGCTALAALTALTVLRVSQDQDSDGGAEPPPRPLPALGQQQPQQQQEGGGTASGAAPQRRRGALLSGMGLTALTGLRNLRQLEWLPWGCEPLELVHVEALASLRRLHLVTLRGARDGAISERALEALRERLPLCDIDDTEWSGLVDV